MKASKKAPWRGVAPFIKRMKREVYRPFFRLVKEGEREELRMHGEATARRLSEALRAIRRAFRLPCDERGTPLLYTLAEDYLRSHRENVSGKTLCDFLEKREERPFYDEEMSLLCPFLTLAAVSLYVEMGEEAFLSALNRLSFLDFERIFYTFSAVERIFLTEAEGVYADSDTRTRRLYHNRLLQKAKRERKDALALCRETVAEANRRRTHIGAVLPPRRGKAGTLYFYFLVVLTLLLSAVYLLLGGKLILLPLVIVPVYTFVKEFLPPFFENVGERSLPRLEKGEALLHTKTLVAVMTLLFGAEKDGAIFDKLEDLYLTNGEENTVFAVFCDLPAAKRRTTDKDDALITYAKGRIASLRAKYGEHFALFIRERRRSVSEDAYIGWERKRGGVLELCRFLRGKKAGFRLFDGNSEALSDVRYLITLDADTNLYIGAVKELVGTMLHPENRPVVDERRGIVKRGHGVLQPRMTTALDSASATPFAELTGGNGGIDIYAGCASDVYEQVFDEGIFCGKGILDIDAYLAVCDGFFPRERILSHDLAEGNLLRSALACDVVLTDSTPKGVLSYYTRADRWLRGDLQMLPYLGKTVRNTAGKRMENPMSPLSKYKILDNFLRAMTPFSVLAALLLSLFWGGRVTAVTSLFSLFYIAAPVLFRFLRGFFDRTLHMAARRFSYFTMPHFLDTAAFALFRLSALAYEAYLFINASLRTLYRFLVSHRNFLNWTTAAEGDGKKGDIDGVISVLWASPVLGLAVAFLPMPLFRVLGLLFLAFPFAMHGLSKERSGGAVLTETERETLQGYAHLAWLYFRELVGEKTNFLPPDNYQISPVERVAMRTSPTNIGLYLLSLLAARDRGDITTAELYTYADGTCRTLSKMLTWNGNFYNWYDIRTLEVLGEPFVSTVDSGNFLTCLVAFCEGLREYVSECPKLLSVLYAYEKMLSSADISALYSKERHLFYIGYNVGTGKFSDSYYDTFMSESRITSYYAVATGAVPREHYFALSRRGIVKGGEQGIASWSGTAFEYFMPALLLPTPKGSLAGEALAFAYRTERRSAVLFEAQGRKRRVFGVSESGYFAFDAEMNYQYRAFGIDTLSLDPCGGEGQVVAPYASFLMLERDPAGILRNLSVQKSLGMTGKFGFYEAIDFDSSRVGDGYAVIKSYMAHHLGMSIVAIANALDGGIFRRRFLRSPKMRASRELLSEKLPVTLRCDTEKKLSPKKELPPRHTDIPEKEHSQYEYDILSPEIALVSNNKTKILASSSGHILLFNGADAICLSDFDRFSLGGGLRLYAVLDGLPFSAVPLGAEPCGFTPSYSFRAKGDFIEYRSVHRDGTREYGVTFRLSVLPDREAVSLSCRISGRMRHAYAVLSFEPILEEKRSYEAHRSFSNLFIESEYDGDEDVLFFLRRRRHDKQEKKLLGIASTAGVASFGTRRDELLPLMAGEKDYAELAVGNLSGKTGAVIVPVGAIRTGEFRGEATFYLGYSQDREELLYTLRSCVNEKNLRERNRKMRDILRLQYAIAGPDRSVDAIERYVLRGFLLGGEGEKSQKTAERGFLYRHGISGALPIVLATVSDDETQKKRLNRLIRLFKYMCIRGIRFDFLILYEESDGYHRPLLRAVTAMVRRAGCENFLSFSGGIFPIAEGGLAPAEREGLLALADVSFDLSVSPDETASRSPRHVPLSQEATEGLLRGFSVNIAEAEPPDIPVLQRIKGGYFHENGFVAEKPHGTAPWAHIVASEQFGTVLTENSLGFSYFRNAGLCKLTPHTADNMREDSGERLILRLFDRFDKDSFRDFDMIAAARYADFGFGYADYYGRAEGVEYRVSVTVSAEHEVKCIHVSLEGGETAGIPLCVCFAVIPCLGERSERSGLYHFEREENSVFVTRCVKGDMAGGLLVSAAQKASVFLCEAAFRSGGRVFDGREEVAVLLSETVLSGRWSGAFFLTSYETEALRNEKKMLCQSDSLCPYRVDDCLFSTLCLHSAEPIFDIIANKWAIYQTLYARIYGRCGFYQVSGAYGFRDQLQDALSMIPVLPEVAKGLILRAASRQYENGSVMHWWHEETGMGIMTRCSDDFLWLPYVASIYAEMTGDEAIFDTEVAFLSSKPLTEREGERYEKMHEGKKASLFFHMLQSVEHGMETGAHGLPLMGSGDWNDGMNLVGAGGKGESVWLAFFEAEVLARLLPLLRKRGMEETACRYEEKRQALLAAAEASFDGVWYRRGYYDDGTPLGSAEREDCKLDLLPQAFAAMVLGGVPRVKTAMEAVYNLLFDRKEQLVRLLYPPFDKDGQSPGYIKGYVPGIRENGGQYTHGGVFAALGFFAEGETEKGTELLFAMHPALRYTDSERAEQYKVEPYVLAGDVYTSPDHMGRGGWSWYTGSAAWYRRAVTEVLCGYTERGGGFYLRPRLSALFSGFSLSVNKAGTRYHIAVSHGAEDHLTLDGTLLEGNAENIFFPFDGGIHEVALRVKEK